VSRRQDNVTPGASKKSTSTALAQVGLNQTASRSRSTSVMPAGAELEKETRGTETEAPQEDQSDEKLYCICKTQYDEDRVMIACDR
jgi:COMPASS component SPP1